MSPFISPLLNGIHRLESNNMPSRSTTNNTFGSFFFGHCFVIIHEYTNCLSNIINRGSMFSLSSLLSLVSTSSLCNQSSSSAFSLSTKTTNIPCSCAAFTMLPAREIGLPRIRFTCKYSYLS